MGGWKADAKKNAINRLKAALTKEKTHGAMACIAAIDVHRRDNLTIALDTVVAWLQSDGRPPLEQADKIMELVKAAEEADHASKGVLPPWG